MPYTASTRQPTVAATVTQRQRMATSRKARKAPMSRPRFSPWCLSRFGSSTTPMRGANSTATTQDTASEAAITTKRL